MKLSAALSLRPPAVISVCGGGGKTSTIECLRRELVAAGHPVISTVTTRIGVHQTGGVLPVLLGAGDQLDTCRREEIARQISEAGWVLVAAEAYPDRLTGVAPALVSELAQLADYVLVEADGARGLPFKAPAAHEPVIPACTTTTLALVGIDALDRPVSAGMVHRPEIICQLTNAAPHTPVTPEIIAQVVTHPAGFFKGTPKEAARVVLINKVNSSAARGRAMMVLQAIRQRECPWPVILCDSLAVDPVSFMSADLDRHG